jgi:signal transduction histidine kinase
MGRLSKMREPSPSLKSVILSLSRAASCLLILCLTIGLATADSVVTNVTGFYQLTPAEAQESRPFRIRSTVTFSDPEWNLLFVEDGEKSMFCKTSQPQVRDGDLVELSGVTALEGQDSRVQNLQVVNLGKGRISAAARTPLKQLGSVGPRRVQVGGTVVRVHNHTGRLFLQLESGGIRCSAFVRDHALDQPMHEWMDWIGAEIQVTGINSSEPGQGKLVNGKLFVSGTNDLLQLRPPKQKLSSLQPILSRQVKEYLKDGEPGPYVYLEGRVWEYQAGKSLILYDPTGLIRAEILQEVDLSNTKEVRVWGRPLMKDGEVQLVDAVFLDVDPRLTPFSVPESLSNPPLLTTTDAVRRMRREEARNGYPVELTGVITYSDPIWSNVFLSDDTGGIYLDLGTNAAPKTMQLVRIRGYTAPGGFSPVVTRPEITVLGTTNLPKPVQVTFGDISLGGYDCQWIEISGWVSSQKPVDHLTVFAVTTAQGEFEVRIPKGGLPVLAERWVQFRGVCGASAGKPGSSIIGIRLSVPAFQDEFVHVLPQTSASEATPPDSILDLRTFNPRVDTTRFSKVGGCVTFARPPTKYYLQDDTGGLLVEPRWSLDLRLGDYCELIGFPVRQGDQVMLRAVKVTSAHATNPPPPTSVTPREIVSSGEHHAELVRITGRIVQTRPRSEYSVIYLQEAGIDFGAVLDRVGEIPSFCQPGARVAVTGICVRHQEAEEQLSGFRILLRGPTDLELVDPPPFWSLTRILQGTAVMGGLMLVAFVWVALLRRRVQEQTDLVRQRLESEAKLRDRLRSAQKMEAVGQLAGGIAHDFNNILTVIQGNLGLALGTAGMPQEAVSCVQDAEAAAERASKLTRQLLAFSRKQVLQATTVDLNEVVAGMGKMLGRLLGEQIQLECRYAPALPLIKADPHMLEQILMNLCVNARDAMPAGGVLSIATQRVTLEESQAEIHPEGRPGEFVVLTVSDTGLGMSKEVLQHIFEPFFTTKDVGKGTGLGLATVLGIAQQHEGWVEAQSTPGKGSSLRVYLPVPEKPIQAAPPLQTQSECANGSGVILVAEDEPSVRLLLCACLKRAGYVVLQARDGAEALNLWASQRDEIDLLVTDMVMPGGISGRDLAQRLRAERPTLPVLYTSGYSAEMVNEGLDLQPGINYLPKPYTPALITQTVSRCLAQRSGPGTSPLTEGV